MRLSRLLSALIVLTAPLSAKVSDQEAADLRGKLTPMGAIRAGNANGSIPEWDGGIRSTPLDYYRGQHHPDPYADDEPLFVINSGNYQQFREKLSTGQQAMFEKYPSWEMRVYPTRRSASFPAHVYEAVLDNATSAELTSDGNGVTNARVASPFPIPQNGLEVVWNHLLRFRGHQIERRFVQAVPTSSGSYTPIRFHEKVLIPYNDENATTETIDNRLAYFLQTVESPAYLAGQILLVHETLNQNSEPRLAWTYNPGTRRVRRAPNIAFDNPGTASDGQRTTDQFDMFNGSPERYNWTLVGRTEMVMPYNSYKLHSNKLKYSDIVKKGHMNPEHLRYELHRVWVVEATLKEGTSHIYGKRVFFLDEDSWQIVHADQYDSRGNIWRVSEGHGVNYYEVPLYWDTVQAHYDLQNGRYLVLGLNNEERTIEDFEVNFTRGDFMPEQLRRKGRR